jgi:hypothetical protein
MPVAGARVDPTTGQLSAAAKKPLDDPNAAAPAASGFAGSKVGASGITAPAGTPAPGAGTWTADPTKTTAPADNWTHTWAPATNVINGVQGPNGQLPADPYGNANQSANMDLVKAQQLRDSLATAAGQPVNRTAAQIGAAPTVTAAQAANPGFGSATMASTAQAASPQQISAQQIAAAQAAAAPQITQNLNAAAGFVQNQRNIEGQRVNTVTTGPAATVAPTTVAQTPAAQAAAANAVEAGAIANANQGTQQDALGLIRNAANGNGPTAAQAQFQKALDQAIYAQRSIASSAHGPGRMAAALAAGQNVARLTGQSAADAAALRASEQQGAQNQFLQGSGTARGQDITLGLGNAGLANQVALQNASLGTNVNLANQSTGLQTNLTQAQLAAQAAAQNAAAQNTAQLTSSQFAQQSALANQANALDVEKTNQAVGLQTGLANAGFTQGANLANQSTALEQARANQAAALQTNLANAGFQQQANVGNVGNALTASQSNQNAGLQTALANAGMANNVNLANAGASNALNLTAGQTAAQLAAQNAALANTANLANASNAIEVGKANAGLQQNQLTIDDAKNAQSVIQALQSQSQVLQTDDARAKNALMQQQINAAIQSGDRNFLSQVLGTVLGVGGAIAGSLIAPGVGTAAGAAAGKAAGDFLGDDG